MARHLNGQNGSPMMQEAGEAEANTILTSASFHDYRLVLPPTGEPGDAHRGSATWTLDYKMQHLSTSHPHNLSHTRQTSR